MTEPTSLRNVIDRSTLVPMGVVLAIVAGAIGHFTYLNGKFFEIQKAMEGADRRLERMERDFSRTNSDRWTHSDQRIWALELQQANPSLKIPKPTKNSDD